ncbi:MAG TPA: ABC-F family ATP-binding cassette domain-containing protein [Solirubrobacteraceae bacterium]|jgi:ATP-binding cassette subfamily F protein uup|nr:ABC-F family ATP-binding cassette domain-containing protein [Solirubrobacteraceae bacterium]
MSTTVRNLVNLSAVSKGYAARTILEDVTLGISDRDRIGVVGGNGQGKSTLLELIAGTETPDSGQVTRVGGLSIDVLDQTDRLAAGDTIRDVLVGDRADHEWAGNREFRGVLEGLLGGVTLDRFTDGVDTAIEGLSGGERRRIALARVLLDHPDLLLLDEPTNHLDVEAIAWLAGHLAARDGAMLVVTHDRWFLDAVCTHTWEVADRSIHQYEGGYAAYVLARAERDRQQSAREDRRRQLVRKELAWLRRGPPARTSKPKFRIEAANVLIADEPPIRDSTELLRFANSRLGNKVIEAEDISYGYGGHTVIDHVTWRLGPGDRVALVGTNGSGKSTLLRLLAGEIEPTRGQVQRGETVKLAHLSQEATEITGQRTVLEAVEEVRRRATLAGGEELSAGKLAERFGFRGEKARTRVSDLSGGERRRLTLMRLLMSEPNVLLLDEPTNDLDIETLTALEDLLDHWPGTLLVVSHDRYFVERVADNVFALDAVGGIRHLPGGIDQYLAELAAAAPAPRRARALENENHSHSHSGATPAGSVGRTATRSGATPAGSVGRTATRSGATPAGSVGRTAAQKPGATLRNARKELQRLEREIERSSDRERALHEQMVANATDHTRLGDLTAELKALIAERERLETQWLEAATLLEPH